MTVRAFAVFALLLSALSIFSGAARAEKRLALVIGNSNYRTVTILPNPAKDAEAVADMLRSAQFEVTEADNLAQADMAQAVRDFAGKIAQSGPDTVALVFYAGHGLQIDGENYLVPVDVDIKREADVPIQAMRLHDVMNILSAVPSATLMVVLDACRNNPFSDINKTIGKGLAIVDAPEGAFVSYSTSPGATALDGAGDHSPFTAALLKIARRPGVPVEQTFKSVRIAVHKTTHGQQTPWESTSLTAEFEFFPGDANAPKPENKSEEKTKQRTVAEWKTRIVKLAPEEAYDLVIAADTVEAYKAFLAVFPRFEYVTRVRTLVERRVEMIAWYDAVTLDSVPAFETFLARFPDSDLAASAKHLLERAKRRLRSLSARGDAGFIAAAAPPPKVVTKVVHSPPEVITKVVHSPPEVITKVVHAPPEVITKVVHAPPKVITKVVHTPPKVITKVKVVKKPVVVTRVVKQVVRVPSRCYCRSGGGRHQFRGHFNRR